MRHRSTRRPSTERPATHKHVHHGRTPAAWAGTLIALVGLHRRRRSRWCSARTGRSFWIGVALVRRRHRSPPSSCASSATAPTDRVEHVGALDDIIAGVREDLAVRQAQVPSTG